MQKIRSLDDAPPNARLLVHVDLRTGIILNFEGEYATDGQTCYRCFPSEAVAREFADEQLAKEPLGEWMLLDERGAEIAVLRNERALEHERSKAEVEATRTTWWRRLFKS